jgi:LPXTG-motif cell wall-anchored protein
MRGRFGIGLTVALLVAVFVGTGALAQGSQVTGEVSVQDQSGDGATVTVPEATISGSNGWVAIHQVEGGQPGPVVGAAYITEGASQDVSVTLDQPLTASQTLSAMIHTDDPADQSYTFPEDNSTDPPVTVNEQVVNQPFQFTLSDISMPETGGVSLTAILLAGGVALLSLGLGAGYLGRRRA